MIQTKNVLNPKYPKLNLAQAIDLKWPKLEIT